MVSTRIPKLDCNKVPNNGSVRYNLIPFSDLPRELCSKLLHLNPELITFTADT